MFCFSWDNKQTKSKRFALVLIISRPNQNILLQFWKQADQIKLVCFVPEPMGQNGNELLLIQKNSDQTKTFCFRSDLKGTKSKRFGFVPIISFDIGAFLLSFRYRWHYYAVLAVSAALQDTSPTLTAEPAKPQTSRPPADTPCPVF
jgi:hypothetical protein